MQRGQELHHSPYRRYPVALREVSHRIQADSKILQQPSHQVNICDVQEDPTYLLMNVVPLHHFLVRLQSQVNPFQNWMLKYAKVSTLC